MSILLVVGARPNFMKIAPIQAELDRRQVDNTLVHTGQHYDASMSDIFFEELSIRPPDHHLGVGSASHAVQTARTMEAFEPIVEALRPRWVVVPGDVNSTLACSLVAVKLGCRVAHVEAGLRSRDWSMPEEINRIVTDSVSDLLLAPSPDAVDNLRVEGHPDERIALVGNVMVDTLLTNLDRAQRRPVLSTLGVEPGGYGLVTLHRPSNVDDPPALARLLGALKVIAADVPLLWPAHPRVAGLLETIRIPEGVRVVAPVGYLDSVALQAGAVLVLTDSGGVQEETTVLGVPCITLRTTTERPITVTDGTNRLAGTDPDAIVAAATAVRRDGFARRRPALWDGRAAERIVDWLCVHPPPRRSAG
jgi:UDP-N-acetylglucosamine 2-epimerase (non-hydrolysing)